MEVSQNLVNLNADNETCYEESHSNFSEALQDSENEPCASEPESLCRENDIIFCGSEVTSDIHNRVVVICPDFQNFGLTVKLSSDKPKESVLFLKSKNPRSLKERVTWP